MAVVNRNQMNKCERESQGDHMTFEEGLGTAEPAWAIYSSKTVLIQGLYHGHTDINTTTVSST